MNTDAVTLSEEMALWAVGLRYEDLPDNVIHHIKRSLMDHMGVAIMGATSKLAQTVQTYLAEIEGRGRASVIGTELMLSPLNAAFANGIAALVCELDGGHVVANLHDGATCIPAILAMAEVKGSSYQDVILAIAAAYEVSTRLTLAAEVASERFHTSPLVGVFGAATGTAKILGCDANAMAHALGLAGSYTGGLHDFYGGWLDAWLVNGARVNREGLLCANLAARGISGPLDIFEGPRGFSPAFTDGRFNSDIARSGIGHDWLMLNAYIKMYPSCRRVHSVIDAALDLRKKLGRDTNRFDEIIVEVSEEGAQLDFKNPDSVASAQMSVSYCTAIALEYGTPTLFHFEEAARQDPRVLRLIDRVKVCAAANPIIADPKKLAARVSISINGTTTTETVIDPLGDPTNPVSDEALVRKFHDLADLVVGRESAERLRATIWDFDHSKEADGERLWSKQFFKHCKPKSLASHG